MTVSKRAFDALVLHRAKKGLRDMRQAKKNRPAKKGGSP